MKRIDDWLITAEVDIDEYLFDRSEVNISQYLLREFSYNLVDHFKNKIKIEQVDSRMSYTKRYRTQAFLLPKNDLSSFLDTMSESEVFADKVGDFLLWMQDNNLEPTWSKRTNKNLYREYLLNRKQNNQCNF